MDSSIKIKVNSNELNGPTNVKFGIDSTTFLNDWGVSQGKAVWDNWVNQVSAVGQEWKDVADYFSADKWNSEEFENEVRENFGLPSKESYGTWAEEGFGQHFTDTWAAFGDSFKAKFGNKDFWTSKAQNLGMKLLQSVVNTMGQPKNNDSENPGSANGAKAAIPLGSPVKTNYLYTSGGVKTQISYPTFNLANIGIPDLMKNAYSAYFVIDGQRNMIFPEKEAVIDMDSNSTAAKSAKQKDVGQNWVLGSRIGYDNWVNKITGNRTVINKEFQKSPYLTTPLAAYTNTNEETIDGFIVNTFPQMGKSHSTVFGVRLQGIKIPQYKQETFTLPIANGVSITKTGTKTSIERTLDLTIDMDQNLFMLDAFNLMAQNYSALYDRSSALDFLSNEEANKIKMGDRQNFINKYITQFFPALYTRKFKTDTDEVSMSKVNLVVDIHTQPMHTFSPAKLSRSMYVPHVKNNFADDEKTNSWPLDDKKVDERDVNMNLTDKNRNPWTSTKIIRYVFEDVVCLGQSGNIEFNSGSADKIAVGFKFTYKRVYEMDRTDF